MIGSPAALHLKGKAVGETLDLILRRCQDLLQVRLRSIRGI